MRLLTHVLTVLVLYAGHSHSAGDGASKVCSPASPSQSGCAPNPSSDALLEAARLGDARSFHNLLQKIDASDLLQARDHDGGSVLRVALRGAYSTMPQKHPSGHLAILRQALTAAPLLLQPNAEEALCPLFDAVTLRVAGALQPLLDLGDSTALSACLRERDANNNTVLMYALLSQASGMSRLFLAHPTGVSERLRHDMGLDQTALGSVALRFKLLTKACGVQNVKALLEARANPLERDSFGRNAWHLAASEGRRTVLPLLANWTTHNLPSEASRASDSYAALAVGGWTPAQMAKSAGFVSIEQFLSGVNAQTSKQQAPPLSAMALVAPPGGWAHRPSGGWSQSHAADHYDWNGCDIDMLDCASLSEADFAALYLVPNRPVLLCGCARGWPAEERWSKHSIVERYGNVTLNTGKIAFPETYGLRATQRTLAELVDDAESEDALRLEPGTRVPEFAFDAEIVQKTKGALQDDYSLPAWMQHRVPTLTEFSFGQALSGANLHFHGSVFSGLVHGRKRWALVPPANAYFSTTPSRQWFDSVKASKPFVHHCIQRAGDMMYVPRNWGHAVINLQTSVAVVNEYT